MIQEFAYIREIENKLCGPLGFISERPLDPHTQVWCDLVSNNPFERDYKAFLTGKLAEYRNAIAVMQQFDLHALNRVRTTELLAHFQRAQGVRSNLSRPGCSTAESRFIYALQVLTIGYISATAWEYIKPGRNMDANGFLAPFLSAGLTIEELAQSAEQQGITDADTFVQFLSGHAGDNKAPGKPQPKETILNNHTAVALLDKMKDAGLLDAAYQWIGMHTNYEKATFAAYIDNKATIGEWDKSFCDLWGLKHRTLSKAYADIANKSPKTQAKYNEMLAIFDTTTK